MFGPAAPVGLIGAPEPDAAALTFLDAVNEGDYAALCALCLSPLPAEESPTDADAAALYDLLRSSWHAELAGSAVRDGNTAVFPVRFEALDVPDLCNGLKEDVNEILADYVEKAALNSDVCHEDGTYRNEVVISAWNEAFFTRLSHAGDHTFFMNLELELRYVDHRWQVFLSREWMNALSGGV